MTELGLDGDRRWGVVDNETGGVLTAKREGRLLLAQARLSGDGVVITLPDGTETDESQAVAQWLDRDVSLVAAGHEGGVFENPRDFENETDFVSWQGPPGAWHDMRRARLSIVSIGTLGAWDARRFRSNVVLAGDGEDTLVGSMVAFGTAVLSIEKQLDRCVMVTREQPGLPRDLDVLRTINRERGSFLGVGALVRRDGEVHVGDHLTPLA